eukprot:TRINITY_DN35484_c0_g1_i1.p1 TRINITY_DN35484_c0_g1~~TRINITY_DN35484_c0_g1_i1.p1  ORF type:complete len:730 (-),score=243.73 TRINITY_DN35484_c0_g1_i1:36-2159(-)
MESFFLSETIKYLYLLFDLAVDGDNLVEKGAYEYVFSTEGHLFPLTPEIALPDEHCTYLGSFCTKQEEKEESVLAEDFGEEESVKEGGGAKEAQQESQEEQEDLRKELQKKHQQGIEKGAASAEASPEQKGEKQVQSEKNAQQLHKQETEQQPQQNDQRQKQEDQRLGMQASVGNEQTPPEQEQQRLKPDEKDLQGLHKQQEEQAREAAGEGVKLSLMEEENKMADIEEGNRKGGSTESQKHVNPKALSIQEADLQGLLDKEAHLRPERELASPFNVVQADKKSREEANVNEEASLRDGVEQGGMEAGEESVRRAFSNKVQESIAGVNEDVAGGAASAGTYPKEGHMGSPERRPGAARKIVDESKGGPGVGGGDILVGYQTAEECRREAREFGDDEAICEGPSLTRMEENEGAAAQKEARIDKERNLDHLAERRERVRPRTTEGKEGATGKTVQGEGNQGARGDSKTRGGGEKEDAVEKGKRKEETRGTKKPEVIEEEDAEEEDEDSISFNLEASCSRLSFWRQLGVAGVCDAATLHQQQQQQEQVRSQQQEQQRQLQQLFRQQQEHMHVQHQIHLQHQEHLRQQLHIQQQQQEQLQQKSHAVLVSHPIHQQQQQFVVTLSGSEGMLIQHLLQQQSHLQALQGLHAKQMEKFQKPMVPKILPQVMNLQQLHAVHAKQQQQQEAEHEEYEGKVEGGEKGRARRVRGQS